MSQFPTVSKSTVEPSRLVPVQQVQAPDRLKSSTEVETPSQDVQQQAPPKRTGSQTALPSSEERTGDIAIAETRSVSRTMSAELLPEQLSQPGSKVVESGSEGAKAPADTHWYDDREMNTLLTQRAGLLPNTTAMAPISSQEIGMMPGFLAETLANEFIRISNLPPGQHTLLLPYNHNNNHWTGLRIDIDTRQADNPIQFRYMDSILDGNGQARGIPLALATELTFFTSMTGRDTQIQATTHFTQTDGHSCGPLTVENLLTPNAGNLAPHPNLLDLRNTHRLATGIAPQVSSASPSFSERNANRANVLSQLKALNLSHEELTGLAKALSDSKGDVQAFKKSFLTVFSSKLTNKESAEAKSLSKLYQGFVQTPKVEPKTPIMRDLGDTQVFSSRITQFGQPSASSKLLGVKVGLSHMQAKLLGSGAYDSRERVALFREAFAERNLTIPEHLNNILDRISAQGSGAALSQFATDKEFQLKPCEIGETYHILAASLLMGTNQISRIGNEKTTDPDFSKKQLGLAESVGLRIKDKTSLGKFSDNKINEELLAPFFIADGPLATVNTLRDHFLEGADRDGVTNFLNKHALLPSTGTEAPKRVALWLSDKTKEGNWVDLKSEIAQISEELKKAGVTEVILMGDKMKDLSAIEAGFGTIKTYNLAGFHSQPPFGEMRNQLLLQDMLYREGGMICNIGNKSGGLDGGTMIGIPQVFMEAVTPDKGPFTRIGFSATFSPFWNQICTDPGTGKLAIPEGELARQVSICSDTRTWHQTSTAKTPADIAKDCKAEIDMHVLQTPPDVRRAQLQTYAPGSSESLPAALEELCTRQAPLHGIKDSAVKTQIYEQFTAELHNSLKTAFKDDLREMLKKYESKAKTALMLDKPSASLEEADKQQLNQNFASLVQDIVKAEKLTKSVEIKLLKEVVMEFSRANRPKAE